ncbi:KAT8 regulatory NSL complex subunit 3 [Asbolus verrucosus]|uniref:KAT8 regulatory NSL complex subunit 3 n=1 Tax=Asbolus verrucosus TaxID=1661398 RepID=A0A482V8I8_ASBVE|nr:KAT8 regulatory NSL complex subunit 3 [Asbolus verrucosus]
MVVGNDGRYAYTSHLINPYDREHWWIPMDHCYARPWNWRPESTFLRPTKTLFMPKPQTTKRKSINPLARVQECDEVIDVVTEPAEPAPIYDKVKANHLMEECERHAALARVDEGNENWEETISRVTWTPTKNRLFNGMVNILNSDHLARLAHTNLHNEPVARRIIIDKSVERVRRLMATVSWDTKYTQWLHQLLIDNLSKQYLAAYLDILQTLKSKLPTFVDKLLSGFSSNRLSVLGYENLFPLLKRPWDPIASSLMQDKPKKLPGNPVIVVVPSTPISSKRMLKWINLLSNLATVITIPSNYVGTAVHKTAMMNCMDQMFVMTRNKIQDLRMDYPGRNIVLVGFGYGATLALQIAQVEQVLCVISIGFSLVTAEGRRGEPDDNLLELQCPVLFVIGQCSNTSLQEDMEDLRERMRVETGLIVVGSADDNLRVNKKKKKSEGITQSVVDRCVTDEIGEFISGVILSPYPPQIRQSPTNLTTDAVLSKKVKTERKRYNSNTSSVDSEPPSPTPRISRPGQNNSPSNLGRPPGSKSKAKLEAKWAAQGTSSSPSNSPPPPSIINTPDTSSNDSILTDKTLLNPPETSLPVKKIKILKPTVSSPEKPTISTNHNTSASSNQTAKTLGPQNRSLSNLLQGDFQTLIQSPVIKSGPSGIKVLENVKLTSSVNPKLLSNSGKMIDMSKISVINTKTANGNSIVLLPDGKIKNLASNVKVPGGRYITSKRQLIGNKPPKPVKKISYVPQPCSLQSTNLPPPTNLTTQDILDLPIIFADDNQILENPLPHPEVKSAPQMVASTSSAKIIPTNAGNKFMLINKPSNFILSNSKSVAMAQPQTKMTPKYTKIILSSKRTPEPTTASNIITKISNLSPEISVKKIIPLETTSTAPSRVEELDLENEIAASTLYKPTISSGGEDGATVAKRPEEASDALAAGSNEAVKSDLRTETVYKRSAEEAQITENEQEGAPSKIIKLDND